MNIPTNKKTTDSQLKNLYIKPTKDKGVNAPRYPQFADGYYHQADILFLPNDDDYRYALVVVDVGSRLVDARALKSKSADEVLDAFKSIYSGKILKAPTHVISFDKGHEFLGGVKKYFTDDLNIQIKLAKPGRHTQQSIVERKNKDIGKLLFVRMTGEELQTGEVSTDWVDYLPTAISVINKKTKKRKIKKNLDTPLEKMKVLCDGDACEALEQGTKVRAMLDEPVNAYDGKKLHGTFRETDIRFAIKPRTVMKTLIAPGSPIMYLLDTPDGDTDYSVAYTKNQLQVIPENEKKPSESDIIGRREKGVRKWIVEKLVDRKKVKGKIVFTVKWKGFKDPTEVSRVDLMKDVPDLVKDFEKNSKVS